MAQNDSYVDQLPPFCEPLPETCLPRALPGASPGALPPLPLRSGLAETPSATITSLSTPELVHAQVDGERHHSQFIFYPISWDGTESVRSSEMRDEPSAKSNSNEECQPDWEASDPGEHNEVIDCIPPAHPFQDSFHMIDRWRRHILGGTCGGSSELLDPVDDADVSLPLLSLPHSDSLVGDPHSEGWYPVPFSASSASEDDVQVWVDQWSVDGIFGRS